VHVAGLARHKQHNDGKHQAKKRRAYEMIQEDAGTTVAHQNAVAGKAALSGYMLLDLHFAESRNCDLHGRPSSAEQIASPFIRLQMNSGPRVS